MYKRHDLTYPELLLHDRNTKYKYLPSHYGYVDHAANCPIIVLNIYLLILIEMNVWSRAFINRRSDGEQLRRKGRDMTPMSS